MSGKSKTNKKKVTSQVSASDLGLNFFFKLDFTYISKSEMIKFWEYFENS